MRDRETRGPRTILTRSRALQRKPLFADPDEVLGTHRALRERDDADCPLTATPSGTDREVLPGLAGVKLPRDRRGHRIQQGARVDDPLGQMGTARLDVAGAGRPRRVLLLDDERGPGEGP